MWFLASFDLGTRISLGYCRFEDGQPTATSITTGDGSWAEVTLAHDHGVHHVTEGGPHQVWRIIRARWALRCRRGWVAASSGRPGPRTRRCAGWGWR